MYTWLQSALDDSTCIITANRRLARELQSAWGEFQIAGGAAAWRTPDIQPWQSWLAGQLAAADSRADIPTRINTHQSQVLWERCLRKELGDSVSGVPALVRLARDTWQRLADARVSIREVARSAQSEDQRLYAAAAGRYLAILEREHWIDDAGLAAQVLELTDAGQVSLFKRYVFAGFDRARPAVTALQAALTNAGCEVILQPPTARGATPVVHEFEQRDSELRSAGAWARRVVEARPGAHVAVVVQGLEQTAMRDLRLLREGFVPGWQYGPLSLRDAVNISYGRRLSEFPAVAIGLLALRWLVKDLSASEVSRLLQSPLVGNGELAARSRLELYLRQMPDRAWAPSMITAALRGRDEAAGGSDWLARIAAFSKRRRELPKYASPADWVMVIDDCLRALGWPGPGTRSSDSYQLINRWRELLNDFARLDLVSSSMSAAAAISQFEQMASETVFQPESRRASVQLMGPLEASGAEFDAIWIAGLTASNWPPAGNSSPLISRQLQLQHGMPDASPADTREWAATTLQRLTGSAPDVVCSYALVDDDVEQTATDLLGEFDAVAEPEDPGWHAAQLAGRLATEIVDDAIPPVRNEKIYGGATTIQHQLSEPFSAFAFGRLGVRSIDRQAVGIPALLRGNLVHDTMFRLYHGLPSADELRKISDSELVFAIGEAAEAATQRHLRQGDAVLHQLLQLERDRTLEVVTDFVLKDRQRGDFKVDALEGELEFERGALRLKLRFDRIDRYADGSIGIIDYKTGAARQLLLRDGTVKEVQLFVYAAATDEPVAMLALANLDPRDTGFNGAGRGFTDEGSWQGLLEAVTGDIDAACTQLVAGDVRVIAGQGASKARQLNLLSRYTEMRHDD